MLTRPDQTPQSQVEAALESLNCALNMLERRKEDASRSRQGSSEAEALQYIAARRVPKEYNPKLFSDPAWDMLLDLFVASQKKKEITVSSACIAAECPPTTALRYLGLMEKNRLITLLNHSSDKRKRVVTITETGKGIVKSFLNAMHQTNSDIRCSSCR